MRRIGDSDQFPSWRAVVSTHLFTSRRDAKVAKVIFIGFNSPSLALNVFSGRKPKTPNGSIVIYH
jgi:hypothetical protein